MQCMVTKNVRDIPESIRLTVEKWVGRQLAADQQLFILVRDPVATPSSAARRNAAAGIRQIIAEAQTHADARGITDKEADAAVEEAMAHVRRRSG